MAISWTSTSTDVPPIRLSEEDLRTARGMARSYLQCQVLTCLTSADGLTLPAFADNTPNPTANEERIVTFMRRLWDCGYDLERRRQFRHGRFDVWWITGIGGEGAERRFPNKDTATTLG